MSPQLPKSYKVAVWTQQNGDLVLEDYELKTPKPGQVLIKTLACGVCHSDGGVRAGAFGGFRKVVPGHEVIGDIVAVGEGEPLWKVGDRVGGAWHGGQDQTCTNCKHGNFQFCDNQVINGVMIDGGYAEYVLLNSVAAVRISKDVDPVKTAPLLCAGVTVFNSIRVQGIVAGSTVAIQGLGGLGHLGVQYASRMGYRVVAISSGSAKRDFAKKLGAHEYVDTSKQDPVEALNALGGAALIVATAPNPEAIAPLVNGLATRGKLLVLAPAGEIPVNTTTLLMKGLSVTGWPSGHAIDCEEAIEFARVHGVECMVEPFSLQDSQKAFEHMMAGKVRFRSVLKF